MELPGSLELALAVQKGEWPHTTDASVWAKEFLKRFPRPDTPNDPFYDEADLIGWFANAIMAGYDHATHVALNKTHNAGVQRRGRAQRGTVCWNTLLARSLTENHNGTIMVYLLS